MYAAINKVLIRINANGFQPTEDISAKEVFTPSAEIAITNNQDENVDKGAFNSVEIKSKLPITTKNIKPSKKKGKIWLELESVETRSMGPLLR